MPEQTEGKIIVKGVEYPFPDKLTIGESMDVEKIVLGQGQIHMMAAMVWIAMRRKDPETTFEQIAELDMEDFDVVEPVEGDARPPARAASVKTRKSRATSGRRRSATTSGSGPGKSES